MIISVVNHTHGKIADERVFKNMSDEPGDGPSDGSWPHGSWLHWSGLSIHNL
jgi:hypothetical protein